ncbi:hypothetical protein DYB34_002723 [Aphanomyces astaci]|uniref:NADP-dependent oxidoreductase domain-containing protein n=2 Tax=Aphanomyces astaci TaxID=112090 RepID=A0A3R6ZJ06_APHAT|nr:hypothetical protein DYB34_002723 [Aphanomyces astaci]
MNSMALLHTGRATAAGASAILSKANVQSTAALRFPGAPASSDGVSIAPLGYGSPATFVKDTQVIAEVKAAVLTRGSNLVQTHFSYSRDPANDENLGRLGESIAINELLSEDDVPREGLVISAILDEDVLSHDRPSLSVQDRLSSVVLHEHLEQILRLLDVEVLDLLIVRLPADLFTLPADAAAVLIQGAVAGLEASVQDNLLQGYGFALPSAFMTSPHDEDINLSNDRIHTFLSSVLLPHLQSGCVAIQRRTNLQEGHAFPSSSSFSWPAHIQWIGEFPLDIHVKHGTRSKPLHLKSTQGAHNGVEVAAKLKESFAFALNVETKYHHELFPAHSALLPPPDDVAWAHILAAQHAQFDNLTEWTYIRETQIQPRLEALLQQLQGIEATKDFSFAYSVAMRTLLRHFDVSIDMVATNHNDRILTSVVEGPLKSDSEHDHTIEDIGLLVAQSCRPVDVVLVAQEVPASSMQPRRKLSTTTLDSIQALESQWNDLE